MNDRKRTWQLLHQEIRARALGVDSDPTWAQQFGLVIRQADSFTDLIVELAGFGATFALMDREPGRALRMADHIGARVMQESDEPDDDDDPGGAS